MAQRNVKNVEGEDPQMRSKTIFTEIEGMKYLA